MVDDDRRTHERLPCRSRLAELNSRRHRATDSRTVVITSKHGWQDGQDACMHCMENSADADADADGDEHQSPLHGKSQRCCTQLRLVSACAEIERISVECLVRERRKLRSKTHA